MKALRQRLALACCTPFLFALGCGRTREAAPAAPAGFFHHTAPHGGTIVALGEGDYNLEVVRDAAAGTLSIYLFDDDMENFIRSPAPSLSLSATADGSTRTLLLAAVANPATGETVGDTSFFQGRAAWLRTTASFRARIASVQARGSVFRDVSFDFPAGPDKD